MLFLMLSFFLWGLIFGILVFCWLAWNYRRFFFKNREKASPFECGFDPKDSSRIPFSLRFFFLLMVFIVFDVEFALILHVPAITNDWYFFFIFCFLAFLVLMCFGSLEEYRRGVLNWKS